MLWGGLVGFSSSLIFSGSQRFWGSVPILKYSYFVGQPSQGRVPVSEQIEIFTTSFGAEGYWIFFSESSRMVLTICAQIGEAPVTPEATLDMG